VHRDLKPENVIVERDNFETEVPRIVDFGIALLRDQTTRLTSAGTILGTPAYMAPEQAQGGDPDPRTDLFALGVMLYEMLTGRQPFDGSSMEIVISNMTLDPPAMSQRTSSEIDPLLEAFARKLMARQLCDRFPTARAALEVLELCERDREAAAVALGVTRRVSLPTVPLPPLARPRTMPMGTGAPLSTGGIGAGVHDTNPLARTIAMLRRRAEEERAAATTESIAPGRLRRWPILACVLLVIGGLVGWQLGMRASHDAPAIEVLR
jgi:serine/threonine protein kinase